MAITKVATNFEALFARQNIQKMELASGRAMNRIASGKRVNDASDDPSSIAAITKETAAMRGNRVVQQSLQESIELLKFADSVLAKIENTLIEMNDIAVRIANDATLSTAMASTTLPNAYNKLAKSISSTALSSLKWNNQRADGSNADFASQRIVLDAAGNVATVSAVMTNAFGNAWDIGTLSTASTISAAGASGEIANIQTDLGTIGGYRAEIGGYINVLQQRLDTAMNAEVNHASAVSAIGDADLAAEISNLATSQILAQSATAMVAQANTQAQTVLGLLGT